MAEKSLDKKYSILLIGGSAGSLEVLMQILPKLSADLQLAVIIIVHRKNGESFLTELLNDAAPLIVKEAEDKDPVLPGRIYIAPADYHLLIEKDGTLSLDYSEKINYSRPSIDVTFETAAEAYGPLAIAVLLSGANADGTEGLMKIKEGGGLTIVQDPQEAAISYMPDQAIKTMQIDHIASTAEIAKLINELNKSAS